MNKTYLVLALISVFVLSSAPKCSKKKNCHDSFKVEISYDGVEQLTAQLTGGTAPFSYNWSHGLGSGSIAIAPGSGTYSVTVSEGGGCEAVAIFTIK